MSQTSPLRALRGRLLWFVADPHDVGEAAHRYVADGVLVIEGGMIRAVGPAEAILPTLPAGAEITDHRPHLILPGLIEGIYGVPAPPAMAAITSACPALKGVIQYSSPPTKAATIAPISHAR